MRNLRILHVDDDSRYLAGVKRLVEQVWNAGPGPVRYDYTSLSDFGGALELLELREPSEPPFDVVIIDIRNGNTSTDYAGLRVVKEIKKRLFVPIIIHSALSGTPEVISQKGPFVRDVPKDRYDDLRASLDEIPKWKAARVGNLILNIVTSNLRQEEANFLWDLADSDWERFSKTSEAELADNIVQRLAAKLLSKTSMPSHYYIRPPFLEPTLQGADIPKDSIVVLGGDILKGSIMKRPEQPGPLGDLPYYHDGYWAVVSASCDLERGGGHIVTLAQATVLDENNAKYRKWAKDPDNGDNQSSLTTYLQNQLVINRHHVLPGWFDIPYLVVDFEATMSVPFNELKQLFELRQKEKERVISDKEQAKLTNYRSAGFNLERVASLNSPFAEQLTSRYGYKYGRIGVAALDADVVLKSLKEALEKSKQEIAASVPPTEQQPS